MIITRQGTEFGLQAYLDNKKSVKQTAFLFAKFYILPRQIIEIISQVPKIPANK